MRIAMIGLPASGKTTLFDAVTGRRDEPGAYVAPGSVHVGMVQVADERLGIVAKVMQPKKVTHAQLEFVDIGGLFSGEKPPPEAVEAMRTADGFVKVARVFENDAVPHLKGSVDPARDLEELNADLFLVDLDSIERRIARLKVAVTKPTPERDENRRELALLERCRAQLDTVGALDRFGLTDDEAKLLRSFAFLTQKPSVRVANIGDDQLDRAAELIAALGDAPGPTLAIAAEIENELLDLAPDERELFMADYGLAELSDQKLVQATLEALDLITFFTGSDKELRAWLIPRGTTAVEAAAGVHTDIARGFIRAEVLQVDDLDTYGSWKEVRAHGKERLEGKDYVVQDGEVIHIRFSV